MAFTSIREHGFERPGDGEQAPILVALADDHEANRGLTRQMDRNRDGRTIEKVEERIAPAALGGLLSTATGLVHTATPIVTGVVSTATDTAAGVVHAAAGQVNGLLNTAAGVVGGAGGLVNGLINTATGQVTSVLGSVAAGASGAAGIGAIGQSISGGFSL